MAPKVLVELSHKSKRTGKKVSVSKSFDLRIPRALLEHEVCANDPDIERFRVFLDSVEKQHERDLKSAGPSEKKRKKTFRSVKEGPSSTHWEEQPRVNGKFAKIDSKRGPGPPIPPPGVVFLDVPPNNSPGADERVRAYGSQSERREDHCRFRSHPRTHRRVSKVRRHRRSCDRHKGFGGYAGACVE